MRWVKHLTNAAQDEKIARLIAEHGHAGYGLWWLVVEAVASRLENSGQPSVTYPVTKWSHLLSLRGSHVRQALLKLQVTGLVTAEWSGSDLTVTIPNLLKYRDEYSRKSGHTPENVRSKKQIQIQKQSTETDTDAKAAAAGAPPAPIPLPVLLSWQMDETYTPFVEAYREVAEVTGKPIIPEDFAEAHFRWGRLDYEQKCLATDNIRKRLTLGVWTGATDPQYIPMPKKYLELEYKRPVLAPKPRDSPGPTRTRQQENADAWSRA